MSVGAYAPETAPCLRCGDPVGPSFGKKPRKYCAACNSAGHGSRVWEPRERRAAYGTYRGRAAVTCWCEAQVVYVTFAEILAGRTASCGRAHCRAAA